MINNPIFLKWAGGKRKIISDLEKYFPQTIERYFEPFLGAGAVFFYIKQKYNPKYSMISDINADLIEAYKTVRDNPKGLIRCLESFRKNNSEPFYYKTREKFNKQKLTGLKRSAAFIYLNKTCFNGLFRVNSKNEFNVPFGSHKNPFIFREETILLASQLLADVVIEHQDYRDIQGLVLSGDFVYLDPCYDPLKKTSFTNYTSKKYCEVDRLELASFIDKLDHKGVNIFLSNNDLPQIRELYSEFKITEIAAERNISADPKLRGQIIELAISNY